MKLIQVVVAALVLFCGLSESALAGTYPMNGEVLIVCQETGINAATTGTAEEVLRTCTLPANALNEYGSFTLAASFHRAANTNSVVPRLRLGSLVGIELAARSSTASEERLAIGVNCTVTAPGQLDCVSWSAKSALGGFITLPVITGLDFTTQIAFMMTGISSVQAGDLTADAWYVRLYK